MNGFVKIRVDSCRFVVPLRRLSDAAFGVFSYENKKMPGRLFEEAGNHESSRIATNLYE
jgi:hypothetical protein